VNAYTNLVLVATVVGMGLSFGCNEGPDGNGATTDPLVYPWEGQLGRDDGWGSTMAILIDSSHILGDATLEYHNLDADRIDLELVDDGTTDGIEWSNPVPVNLRYVFNLGPTRSSEIARALPGFNFTVAVFDLPPASDSEFTITGSGPFEAMGEIDVYVDGGGSPVHTSRIVLTGIEGYPNPLGDPSIFGQGDLMDDLGAQRMIRLQPKRDDPDTTTEVEGPFYEGMGTIGSIEFDFEYSSLCNHTPRVYPANDASNALAYAGPFTFTGTGYRYAGHVVIVDPKGINVAFEESQPPTIIRDETLAGTGPIIDIAFNDNVAYTCDITEESPPNTIWKVSNLLVTALDGTVLVDESGVLVLDTPEDPSSDAAFRMYAVDVRGS